MTDYKSIIIGAFDIARSESQRQILKGHPNDREMQEKIIKRVRDRLNEKEKKAIEEAVAKSKRSNGDLSEEEIAEIVREVMKDYIKDIEEEDKNVTEAIENGVKWLENKRYEDIESPWSASITLMCLLDARKHPDILKIYNENPSEYTMIDDCKRYIIDHQRPDGGWISNYDPNISNIFDSSLAVVSLIRLRYFIQQMESIKSGEDINSELEETINKGINFIKVNRHKQYRGWPPTPDKEIDVGATSWATIALLRAGVDRESNDIKEPINWIKENRRPDYGWGDQYKDAPGNVSVISRTYDALSALIEVGEYPNSFIEKSVEWVSDLGKLIKKDGKWGWGWESFEGSTIFISDVENTALAIMILLCGGRKPDSEEVKVGIDWLLERKETDEKGTRWINTETRDKNPLDETPRVISSLSLYIYKRTIYKKEIEEKERGASDTSV